MMKHMRENGTIPISQQISECVTTVKEKNLDDYQFLKSLFEELFIQEIITRQQLEANRFRFVFDILYLYLRSDTYEPIKKEIKFIFDSLEPLHQEKGNETYYFLKSLFELEP